MLPSALPRQPMKLMLLTAGALATVTIALVLIALSLGIDHRGVDGHR